MFKVFTKNMFNFVLSILFWIFVWNLFELVVEELDVSRKKMIIFYIISIITTLVIIYNDKKFFSFA
jgi:hypothetical protein